ncbi:hypothetical protein N7468_001629 [Penicillium chermesinum]|uniref:Uncharacterized protein n=1 Tax=Penicillium chermesinum TaxID=63820 RepID=A0A9W9PGX0_9EURO|nr:uncharacterized protein N7468_001629 [Penicillium chermesinum]KAJ5246646.1 hypothetical protein N7468_001629 [Penicillium chermesinum]KAJ6144919.1 hypothetical protein N7470_008814 [Penicillium chermesinum]
MLGYNLGDEVMKKYISDGLKRDYDAWTPDRINGHFREMDERNGSYTDQDPWSVGYSRALSIQPPTATLLFTSATGAPPKMICSLRGLTLKTQCAVRAGDDLWVSKAKAGTGDTLWENIRFDLDYNPAGYTSQRRSYKDCILQIL